MTEDELADAWPGLNQALWYLICTECGRSRFTKAAIACTYCGSTRLQLTSDPDKLEPVINYANDRRGDVA